MKQEITWTGLIKKISLEQQAKGTFSGLKEVFGEAKKEWAIIKSGKHGLFSVGQKKNSDKNNKNKTVKKTHHNNKTKKNNKSRKNKIKLCDKCQLCDKCIERNGL